ncbi:hypothetical protein Aduo_013070 [Ancylostoma duodenale]
MMEGHNPTEINAIEEDVPMIKKGNRKGKQIGLSTSTFLMFKGLDCCRESTSGKGKRGARHGKSNGN